MVFCNEFSALKVRDRKHKFSRARGPVKTTTHNIHVYMVWLRPKRRHGGPRRSGIWRCLVSAGRSASLIFKILAAAARTTVAADITVHGVPTVVRENRSCVFCVGKKRKSPWHRGDDDDDDNSSVINFFKKIKGHRVRHRDTARETRTHIVLAIVQPAGTHCHTKTVYACGFHT